MSDNIIGIIVEQCITFPLTPAKKRITLGMELRLRPVSTIYASLLRIVKWGSDLLYAFSVSCFERRERGFLFFHRSHQYVLKQAGNFHCQHVSFFAPKAKLFHKWATHSEFRETTKSPPFRLSMLSLSPSFAAL